MNFTETLTTLYTKTEKITVYAAQSSNWVNGERFPCIGIRSFFAGYENNDPIVDGIPFMICGDAYFTNSKEITDLHDLNWMRTNDGFLTLMAVGGTFPIATIDLGKYEIQNKSNIDDNGNIILHLIRIS